MKHLDLFAGIGGFSFAMDSLVESDHDFVEYEDHLKKVLNKNWPKSQIYGDIINFSPTKQYDIFTGGFPCQDISRANSNKNKEGINGKRSGLWKEYKRVLEEGRPKYCIIENVFDLLKNGINVILRDLAEIGYDATYTVIDSQYCGLPQRRRRVYILGVRDGIAEGADIFECDERSDKLRRESYKRKDNVKEIESHQKEYGVEYFGIQKTGIYRQSNTSSTIRKCGWATGGDIILKDNIARHLTHKEKLKLQGFPEDWTDNCGMNSSQLHSANGMSIPAVKWVIERMVNYDKTLDV